MSGRIILASGSAIRRDILDGAGLDYEVMVRPVDEAAIKSAMLAENTRCLLYTSPSPRDRTRSRMPSSA